MAAPQQVGEGKRPASQKDPDDVADAVFSKAASDWNVAREREDPVPHKDLDDLEDVASWQDSVSGEAEWDLRVVQPIKESPTIEPSQEHAGPLGADALRLQATDPAVDEPDLD